MKSIAILGGRGMLGSDLAALAAEQGFSVQVYGHADCDITNSSQLRQVVESADYVVNCAAYTAVDKAESEPERCREVNATAVAELGRIAAENGKYVVHISTDFVFGDNHDQPLSEDDPVAPLSVYGRTKLEGERLLQDSGCRCGIIRVEWTYGVAGANFISKILELTERLDALKVVEDQVGSPTPTTSIAAAVMCFIRSEVEGLYHFAAKGYASRYEVACFIAEQCGLTTSISPCPSSEFPAPAERPLNSRFDCARIDQELDFERPHWTEALRRFLAQIRA